MEGWTASIAIVQGYAVSGLDRGTVWFDEGRLYFVGTHTSFGLVASQVADALPERKSDTVVVPLRLATKAGDVSLHIVPITKFASYPIDVRDVVRLETQFTDWKRTDTLSEGQWPPLALGPDTPDSRALFARALGTTGFWVVSLVGLIALGFVASWWHVVEVVSVGGFILFWWTSIWEPRARWRAWRDRRRLEKGGP